MMQILEIMFIACRMFSVCSPISRLRTQCNKPESHDQNIDTGP
jgi:hypothetical protein